MAGLNEEARIPVYINDEQAKSALKNLTAEAEKWRKAMYQAMASGDLKGMKDAETQLKKTNRSMADLKKSAFDVDAVMKNISSASARDLRKALQAIDKEMDGINRNTKEYQALANKKLKLKDELGGINSKLRDQGGILGKLKGAAGELLPAFGWGAIAAGAVFAFNKIVNATDSLSTKWAVFTGGLKEATNEFWRTLASGDWSNFITNMKEAVRVGREYEDALDNIEERQRALDMLEAKALRPKMDLEKDLKNILLSRDARIKAGEDLIKIEEELGEKRKELADERYKAQMSKVIQATKLNQEQIESAMSDFDSIEKENAKVYNEKLEELQKLTDELSGSLIVVGRKGKEERQKQLADELTASSTSVKLYAHILRSMGKDTDEQLNKLVALFGEVEKAGVSADENLMRERQRVQSFLNEENKEEQKASDASIVRIEDKTDALKEEAEALKIINESLAEGERLMQEGGEDEFRRLLEDTQRYGELLSRETENRLTAATPVDPNFTTLDQQRTFFDARMALIEEQYQKEKELARGNQAALLAAERNYNRDVYQAKSDLIAAEFALTENRLANAQNYVSALTGIVGQESKLGKAIFLFNQALAVAEIWVQNAKTNFKLYNAALAESAWAGPAAPAVAAALSAAGIAASNANAAINTGLIVAQTVGKFVGKKSGGFTDRAASDNQVADYVHANEFVASAPAVRNPTVKPVLDIIDIAQRTGRIANLNLPAALGGTGRKEGGYSGSGSSSASSSSTINNFYQGDPDLKSLLVELREMMKKGVKAKMFYRDFEEYEKEVEDIRDAANL